MAYLQPENLASSSAVPNAVREVARAFRDLTSDDVLVSLEGSEDRPYLFAIHPRGGVLAIHVIEGGMRGFTGRADGLRRTIGDMRTHASSVAERLAASKHLDSTPAVRPVVAAPSVTRTQADDRGLDTTAMLLSDDFMPAQLEPAIQRLLGEMPPLREVEERAVRAAVHPDIVIRDSRSTAEASKGQLVFNAVGDGPDDLAVLDRVQENLARHLGDGYRVIRGVAGSGKTLVLTFRARFLAENMPDLRILVTCYNVIIAEALSDLLSDVPNVDVENIDRLGYQICREEKIPLEGKGDARFHKMRVAATEALRNGRAGEYDVVLVDEGQDFDNAAFDLAHAHLRPDRDEFVVALDAAQNIYRKKARWNPPGMTARGRTTVLRRNYRNTKEILELAYGMLSRGGIDDTSETSDLDDPAVVVPPEATSRSGPAPAVLEAGNELSEVRAIVSLMLDHHRRSGVPWSDMLVLFPTRRFGRLVDQECRRQDIPHACISAKENKRQAMRLNDVVRSSTLMSIKGVEFSHVYICGVDDIYVPGDDDASRRRLLYVGMTRATDRLVLTRSGSSHIGRDLVELATSS